MVCAAETPLKNTQILGCESLASWIAAVTQTRMDFSRVFVRNWRRITSGPTLRPWRLLGTDPCLLRSSLKSRDTLKYRSWVSALCDFTMCLCLTLSVFLLFMWVESIKKRRGPWTLQQCWGRRPDRWTVRAEEIYWPAEDSPAIMSYYSECNSTATQYYRTEIQHGHLQEVSALLAARGM